MKKDVKSAIASVPQERRQDSSQFIDAVLNAIKVDACERQQICDATVGQWDNQLWHTYRQCRITASNFGLVLAAMKRKRYPPSLFKTLLWAYKMDSAQSVSWGVTHESVALEAYANCKNVVVKPCGLFLSNSGIIGASPDGLIPEQRKIVEIKCPWFARKMTLEELLAADGFYMEFAGDGSVKLKSNHNYFHQVQGCMHLSDTDECDFVVWTTQCVLIVPVLRDPEWAVNIPALEQFYIHQLLPKVLQM